MRIALVINTLTNSGGSLVACNLARGLAERGHDVLVLLLRRPDSADAAAAHIAMVKANPRVTFSDGSPHSLRSVAGLCKAGLAMRRTLKAFRPDIIHSHCEVADLVVAGFARALGAPLVRTAHVDFYLYQYFGFAGPWMEHALNLTGAFARVVAISQQTLDRNRAAKARAILIHNGVFDARQRPDRRPQRVAGSALRAGVVGTLVRGKGQRGLIETMLRVYGTAKRPPYTIAVYGDGPDAAHLKALAAPLDTVVQLLGHEYDRDVIFRNLDALLIVSQNEGMPTVMLEAVSRGVPVLSFAVAGAPDILPRLGCGRIVENFDRLLEALEQGAAALPCVSEAARREVFDDFSIATAAAKHEDMYRQAAPATAHTGTSK